MAAASGTSCLRATAGRSPVVLRFDGKPRTLPDHPFDNAFRSFTLAAVINDAPLDMWIPVVARATRIGVTRIRVYAVFLVLFVQTAPLLFGISQQSVWRTVSLQG